MEAELTHNAGTPAEFPADGLPEVAVAGRSNVGKSSFINALLGRRSLARTSGRPGKTRRLHFYRVGPRVGAGVGEAAEEAFYLVDLPGYGYAAVGREERKSWRRLVESYLRGSRAALRGAILLIDVRRGPEEEERQLLDWLAHERIPAAVALTKSDKLSRQKLANRVHSLADRGLGADLYAAVSGRTGLGMPEALHWLEKWTGRPLR